MLTKKYQLNSNKDYFVLMSKMKKLLNMVLINLTYATNNKIFFDKDLAEQNRNYIMKCLKHKNKNIPHSYNISFLENRC